MSRMEINALTQLANSAEAGGYTLPAELTDALRTYRRVIGVTVPEPHRADPDAAATRYVATMAAGKDADLCQLQLEDGRLGRRRDPRLGPRRGGS